MTMNPHTPARLEQLDGLRGIAAVVVVISHGANAGMLPGFLGQGFGQMGVTLFYALSAFLLGRLYLHQQFSAVTFRRYAVSRISRVLPLFYFVLAVSLVPFMIFGNTFYEIDTIREFALNAALIKGTSVLWSIPVELQYYLAFAGLWAVHARIGGSIGRLMVLGLACQLLAIGVLWIIVPDLGTFNLAYWTHIFLIGLLFSQLSFSPLPRKAAPLQAVLLAVVVILALPELRRIAGLPTAPNFIDPITAGVPLLIFYLALRDAAPLRFLRAGFFRFLGGISFGIYLIHMPVLTVITRMDMGWTSSAMGFAVLLTATIMLAWAARRVIEAPAQDMLKRWLMPASSRVATASPAP